MTSATINEKLEIVLPGPIEIKLHPDATFEALPEYDMTTKVDIKRKVSDTKRIKFTVLDENKEPKDITDWTGIVMSITAIRAPDTGGSLIQQFSGLFVDGCGMNGEVYFSPLGTIGVGKHFYDIQTIDENGEKHTLAEGRYTLTQDRTKI